MLEGKLLATEGFEDFAYLVCVVVDFAHCVLV